MYKRILATAVVAVGASFGARAADIGAHTTVGGQVFADISHVSDRQNGADVAPTGTGFEVKRAYLIVNHSFDDVFSANLTTDAQYVASSSGSGFSSSSTSNSGGATELFIKLLYLQAKLNDAFVVHAGSYPSPWYSYVQTLYGYRWIEKSETERLGFSQSADWGLNASGVAGENGVFNYSASVVDGAGYKNPTRTKDVDFEGQIGVTPLAWLNVGAGFYSGHLGQITQTTADYASNTATRWDVAAAVVTTSLRVGVEYFDAKNFKTASASTGVLSGPGGVVVATNATAANPAGTVASDEADGVSAWASYAFTQRWSVFGRYDQAKPSKHFDPELKDTYYHVGVGFRPIKPLDLGLVYKHEKVANGSISISGADGNSSITIGGTGTATTGAKTSGDYDEIGVYTQFTF